MVERSCFNGLATVVGAQATRGSPLCKCHACQRCRKPWRYRQWKPLLLMISSRHLLFVGVCLDAVPLANGTNMQKDAQLTWRLASHHLQPEADRCRMRSRSTHRGGSACKQPPDAQQGLLAPPGLNHFRPMCCGYCYPCSLCPAAVARLWVGATGAPRSASAT